ncbi:MAG: nitric oxide dioxygenase, partial [Phaeodactylibacter sp.]|nr:nitric oxide dioxygenase [Phaeodactylibacter sp.]
MSKPFYTLKVRALKRETADAVTILFDVPEALKETFRYKAGQYLTLRFAFEGEEARRAYSMCSSPLDDHIAVTIKQVENGLVSHYINNELKAGDSVEAMAPEGRFFTELDADNRKDYYLFAAGSGITPLMSILRTALEAEPQSTVFLFYGNRDEEHIIFREQLDELARKYDNQLIVDHILSQPKKQKGSGLLGFMKKSESSWQGEVGRIDEKQLRRFLAEHPQRSRQGEYFICGPGNMIDTVRSTLLDMGIDKNHIHTVHFVNVHKIKSV